MRKTSLVLAFILVLSATLFLGACKKEDTAKTNEPEETIAEDSEVEVPVEQNEKNLENDDADASEEVSDLPNPIATIEMVDGGKIVVELLPEYAPNTVNNFVTLAQDGFYDEVSFHRIVPGFVIQGGDPDGTGMGGPGYSIFGEFINNGFDQNKLAHTRGVISMARSMDNNSAGSQFFIMLDDATGKHLDQDYAGFGIVLEGMDVVDKIAAAETDANDYPVEPIVIKSVTIDTKGVEDWPKPETM